MIPVVSKKVIQAKVTCRVQYRETFGCVKNCA